jgi:hypothetical protein
VGLTEPPGSDKPTNISTFRPNINTVTYSK